jgi:hypothetical protein
MKIRKLRWMMVVFAVLATIAPAQTLQVGSGEGVGPRGNITNVPRP